MKFFRGKLYIKVFGYFLNYLPPPLKVARYSNAHKHLKQKQRTPNLTLFAQMG